MSRFDEIQQALTVESPLPADLPRIYLLGDTGAGKTTIIRKLLGTEASKFPTTRQTRTTVAPTEYVIWQHEGYDITVVLKPVSEVTGYLEEILSSAITRFYLDRNREQLLRDLRQTSDQRFRLYYLLDRAFMVKVADLIAGLVGGLEEGVRALQQEFPEDEEETGIFVELALSEMGEPYDSLKATVLHEIQRQVAATCNGKQLGTTWSVFKHENPSRDDFLTKCKAILSSETDSISPVIQHARIRGQLYAPWMETDAEAVIIDGEGIGHDTKEAGQLDARHYDYFYQSDLILLIEESKKPFIAGGKNALKSIFQRGYGDKLLLLFTKLDEVEPYDSDDPTDEDRVNEVRDGLTNVSASLKEEGNEIDLATEQAFFLGGLQEAGMNSSAIASVNAVLSHARELSRFNAAFTRPQYDYEMLSAFLVESTKKFHDLYDEMLRQQHWKTVEAFNRRMDMGIDGFRMFTPITDFEERINKEIEGFIASPVSWEREVSDTLKKQSLDQIRREFTKLIIDFARRTIIACPHHDWNTAYMYSGRGSTFRRRADIEAILRRSVPPITSSQSVKQFKDSVKELIQQAIDNCAKAE